MLAKFILVLSIIYILKFFVAIGIKIITNDLKPIKLALYEEYLFYFALSYIITFLII